MNNPQRVISAAVNEFPVFSYIERIFKLICVQDVPDFYVKYVHA